MEFGEIEFKPSVLPKTRGLEREFPLPLGLTSD